MLSRLENLGGGQREFAERGMVCRKFPPSDVVMFGYISGTVGWNFNCPESDQIRKDPTAE
jgi:hypothetical protein